MPYRAEFLLILLWGMFRGWGTQTIAHHAGVHRETVLKYRRRLQARPSEIFHLPVLFPRKRLTKGTRRWHCEVCDQDVDGSETWARKHTAYHFFSIELVEMNGVADPR